jgi:biopolymer transport protein ExbD
MIDTMAFLLVFFMIASLAMTRQQGMPVNLPRADSGAPQTWGDRALVVTITREGRLFLDKLPLQFHDLKAAVAARLAAKPNIIVVINADDRLRHGTVMRAMDLVKQAGAKQVAIATKQAEVISRREP